jgi:hypothetical protein
MMSHFIIVDHYNQARYYCSVNHLDVRRQFVLQADDPHAWNRMSSLARYDQSRGLAFVNLSEKPLPEDLVQYLKVKMYPVESAEDS